MLTIVCVWLFAEHQCLKKFTVVAERSSVLFGILCGVLHGIAGWRHIHSVLLVFRLFPCVALHG